MPANPLPALASAAEGSRELDALVAAHFRIVPSFDASTFIVPLMYDACDDGRVVVRALISAAVGSREENWRTVHVRPAPPFTTSVDAALTLVPEGWAIAKMQDGLNSDAGRYCHVALWCPANRGLGRPYSGNGATPAIAICLAALRAREAGP